MKTKIIKSKGYWRLVVEDEKINKKYGASNESPIMLGKIIEFFDSKCWGLQDYRLQQNLIPNQFLSESQQRILPKNEEDKRFILSMIHSHQMDDEVKGVIKWPHYDSFAFDGDNPVGLYGLDSMKNTQAKFTFKEASKRLYAQKKFWDEYKKNDLTLDEIRIPNPHRQLGSVDIYLLIENNKKAHTKKLKM